MNSLFTPQDAPALCRLGLFFGGIGLWWGAFRFNYWWTSRPGRKTENIWSYLLPFVGLGFIVGAGIGLCQFGGNALQVPDRYAKDDQDWTAFSTGGAWGAFSSVPLALAIAGLVRVHARARERAAERRALAETLARQEVRRRELADKSAQEQAAETLARGLDVALGRKPYLALDQGPGATVFARPEKLKEFSLGKSTATY